jgi:hypothetical protein
MAVNRIDPAPVRLSTKITEARQTPNDSFGSRIQNGAAATANVVASGASVAAPFVPGGAIVSAAVSGVSSMANSASSGQSAVGGGSVGTSFATGGGVGGASVPNTSTGGTAGGVSVTGGGTDAASQMSAVLQQQAASNLQYLGLQNQMQQENQTFSTLSNVLKVRHDTAKNSIGNIH